MAVDTEDLDGLARDGDNQKFSITLSMATIDILDEIACQRASQRATVGREAMKLGISLMLETREVLRERKAARARREAKRLEKAEAVA